MYTDKQKYEFVSLRAEGLSYEKISKKLNIPIRNLFRWGKDMVEEISACKEAALESVLNEHKASATERIGNLALILEKIDTAISKQSFTGWSLLDLMNWKLRVQNELLKHESKLYKPSRNKSTLEKSESLPGNEPASVSDSDQLQMFKDNKI